MASYTFEVVTAITLTVIGIILALYFVVLKRKGWLTENPNESNESFYRCPNQECRKIFQKPVALTDLSHNPPQTYSACPHCGFNLKATLSSTVGKKTARILKTPQSPKKPVVTVKTSKPETPMEPPKTSEKPTVVKNIQKLPTSSSKSFQARPLECSHYLGYLRKIPKNTPMPDECLSCHKMIECISYDFSKQIM